ncbi:hypothetical protein HUK49_06970 [Limosilactobacillus sp. c11Ua_112_M]|uniref:hypothetical protein n=1 Tax=Limosilactobacillus TaxID=2742598 RepID=UPI0017839477|nr:MULTISPECIES: hypothetical protein [Limosilactobacillus]MBD8087682.1 hypothetical protein [Limosilactobacillus portuensis]MEC4742177.1 hypothetical protein [Limosilactobacillus sp. c10Ua_36]
MKLHTDDFPLLLNRDFYNDLIDNFKAIEKAINDLDKQISKLQEQYNDLNKDDIQTELINDAGISVTNNDGETSIIDISDTDTSSEIS